jgi:hypothetical protein
MCGSISRTPRVQPLASSSSTATPNRHSSGGANITVERMPLGSRARAGSSPSPWRNRTMPELKSASTSLPKSVKKVRSLRTSVTSGTPRSTTGSRVSRLAHSTGRTAFLFAEGVIRPLSRRPP